MLTGNFNLAKLCGLIVGRSDDLYSVIGTKIQKHLTYKNFNRWALYNNTIKGKSSREKPLRAYFLSKNKLSITDDLEAIAALEHSQRHKLAEAEKRHKTDYECMAQSRGNHDLGQALFNAEGLS